MNPCSAGESGANVRRRASEDHSLSRDGLREQPSNVSAVRAPCRASILVSARRHGGHAPLVVFRECARIELLTPHGALCGFAEALRIFSRAVSPFLLAHIFQNISGVDVTPCFV